MGTKIGYNLFAKTKTTRDYTTYATYKQYFEDFRDMPNHYYTNYSASANENLHMHIPLSIIGEIGYDVLYGYSVKNYGRDKVFRVGVYCEWGLLNAMSNNTDSSLFETDSGHPTQLKVYSYYNHKAIMHKIWPISAGIKLTLVLLR